jgi:hypothetical protein
MKKKNSLVFVAMLFSNFIFFENLFSSVEGNIWARFVDDEKEREASINDYWLEGCTSSTFSLPEMCGFTFYSFFSPRFPHQYSHRKKS